MGKGWPIHDVAARIRHLTQQADEYFAGRDVKRDPPCFADYAAAHYERYRRDWPEGRERLSEWLAWAREHADRLNPLDGAWKPPVPK